MRLKVSVGKTRGALLAALVRLLSAAEGLEQCTLDVEEAEPWIEMAPADAFLDATADVTFYEMFDPADATSVTPISLKDCLADIYGSLKGGLLMLDRDPLKRPAVLWEWRDDYRVHWGRHLIDTIRFLFLSRGTEVLR